LHLIYRRYNRASQHLRAVLWGECQLAVRPTLG
jgi:hypothetical protein